MMMVFVVGLFDMGKAIKIHLQRLQFVLVPFVPVENLVRDLVRANDQTTYLHENIDLEDNEDISQNPHNYNN